MGVGDESYSLEKLSSPWVRGYYLPPTTHLTSIPTGGNVEITKNCCYFAGKEGFLLHRQKFWKMKDKDKDKRQGMRQAVDKIIANCTQKNWKKKAVDSKMWDWDNKAPALLFTQTLWSYEGTGFSSWKQPISPVPAGPLGRAYIQRWHSAHQY